MLSVAIIIPVFNKWMLTQDCLRSLAEHTPLDCRPAQIIVVDNGSTDETPVACPLLGQELFGDSFVYLRFEFNRNFGPACNAGARVANTDLLFFLNNDTLMTPGWLPPLLAEMEKPDAPIGVGPLLTYADGTVQHLGITFFPAGAVVGHLYRGIPGDHPLAMRRRKFQALTAAALMLPRHVFMEADGFHEEFINGFEDVDLCLRLTGDGKRMTVVPESRIVHLESQTPHRNDNDMRNSQVLRSRHDIAPRDDFGDLLAEDRYILKVEPDFGITIAVPSDRNQELFCRLNEEPSVSHCRELLNEVPYWENGYVRLSSLLVEQGAVEESLAVYQQALRMVPSFDLIDAMMKMAARTGGVVSPVQESCPDFYNFIMDEPRYTEKFYLLLSILRAHHRSLLPAYKEAARKAALLRAEWKSQANG